MPLVRQTVNRNAFNPEANLPFQLRLVDFEAAMQDVYDFFYDVNSYLLGKGLPRLDDMLRKQAASGLISDMLTSSLANHSRTLTENKYHNGHPDLVVAGRFPNDAVQSAGPQDGLEVKSTTKRGGAVDMHGARNQWMAVFVYSIDRETEPAVDRRPLRFTEVYVAEVTTDDFRRNQRGELGTRTATLDRYGLQKLRAGWVYLDR